MSPPQSLDGKGVVVTGGSGGIGRAVVRAFERAGARVAVVDRAPDERVIAADLSTQEGAAEMARAANERLGRVDGLVHVVGGFGMGPVEAAPARDYDRLFDLNVRTLFLAVHALLPSLKAQRGFVCGFASEPAWTGAAPGMALYAASKAAVATFLRSLDGEVAKDGVRVSVVYPMGAVDTPQNRAAMPAFDPAGYIDPDEIAETIVFAASRGPRARLRELPVWPGTSGQ